MVFGPFHSSLDLAYGFFSQSLSEHPFQHIFLSCFAIRNSNENAGSGIAGNTAG